MNFSGNKITELFGIKYPIIQGGMVWCSGWKLASAVSNAGGLGLLGAGSMYPDVLKEHITKMKAATNKPWGVNIPLLYSNIEEIVEMLIAEKVPIVFTSAGSPKKYTKTFQAAGIKVVHVVPAAFLAKKCEDAGVDAIVAEGFEAGGHNGYEETTTFTLIPNVRKTVNIPIIAAGGIATGEQILAAQILGADGVQIGSRFAACKESSAHEIFKQKIIETQEGGTKLSLKKVGPTRLIKNKFFDETEELDKNGASAEEIKEHLGHGRAKLGMFEGNMDEGELEIGQIASMITKIESVDEIFEDLINGFENGKSRLWVNNL